MNKNQNNHARTKLLLKIFGGIFAVAGLVFAVIGFASFFSAMSGGGMPDKFWCCFVGFPLLFIGIALLLFGFRKELASYVKNESAPVINEFAEDVRPAVQTVSAAVRKGLSDTENVVCLNCGKSNPQDAKFCNDCGAALKKVCPRCGKDNKQDAKFCNDCGAKLDE